RRRRSGLTSRVTWPRSPTKQAVPQLRADLTAAARASPAPDVSSVLCAPSPWVSSRIASTGLFERASRPARAAMLATSAAGGVVVHHPLAGSRLLGRYAGADRDHDAAGLMIGDDRFGSAFESRAGIAGLETGAVDVQVTAAHAGCLYLEHDIAGTWRGVGEVAQ